MRLYFSGSSGLVNTPEALTPERAPHIMCSFFEQDVERIGAFLAQANGKKQPTRAGSMFMDSGAYSLFNKNVIKEKKKIKVVGGESFGSDIIAHKRARGSGDYSFFQSKAFFKYCDQYADYMRLHKDDNMMFVNVDVLMNPELTYQTQLYFEKEHGLRPIPVIHAMEPMRYIEKYLNKGYDFLGFGGFGHAIGMDDYRKWADNAFRVVCDGNGGKPQAKVHGFAMTSWKMMCRWPWWSVDSASWVKLSAYGWLYVPLWEQGRWRFDKPHLQINLSDGPMSEDEAKALEADGFGIVVKRKNNSPRGEKRDIHFDTAPAAGQAIVKRWLEHCGVTLKEARSHYKFRSRANIYFFKDLEESRPKWPWALNIGSTQNSFGF